MAVFSAITAAAHPRVSGENPQSPVSTLGREGSSPRERGKRYNLGADGADGGLIPA